MLDGRRAPVPPTRFQTDHPVKFPVFEVPDAWLREHVPNPRPHERCVDFARIAALEALAAAGLGDVVARQGLRIGVCLGTVVGAAMDEDSFYREFRQGDCPDPLPVIRFLRSSPAEAVVERLGLTGPYMTVATACTSGASAICQAVEWIRAGICDAVIAGGTEKLSRLSYNGFASLQITDASACRPFDRDREGLNLGEGAGVILLESPESVARRGVKPVGHLLGTGNASDAYHLSRPDPDGGGLRRAVREALESAGGGLDRVGFINAHGTGTLDNDRMEGRVFRDLLPGVPFHSTKCFTGHTLGAAGGIEAALTLACLNRGCLPVNAGFRNTDPEIGVAPAMGGRFDGDVAMSTSVAYGGNNVALVFGRASERAEHPGCSSPASDATRPRVVVRGVGVAGGFGLGRDALFAAMHEPPPPNASVTVQTPDGDETVPAFLCDDAALAGFVERKRLRRVDHFSRLATLGIAMALDDARVDHVVRDRIGLILATGYGANDTTFRFIDGCLEHGDAGASPLLFSGSGHSGALSHAGILLGITGPALTVCQPHLAATTALATAVQWLRSGLVDVVVVGGVEEYLPLRGYVHRAWLGQREEKTVQAFDFKRETSMIGEGAAFLALAHGGDNAGSDDIVLAQAFVAREDDTTGLDGIDDAENAPVLIAADGNRCRGLHCGRVVEHHPSRTWATFAPVFGAMPVGSAMHWAAAVEALKRGRLPEPPPGNWLGGAPPSLSAHPPRRIQSVEVAKDGCLGVVTLENHEESCT